MNTTNYKSTSQPSDLGLNVSNRFLLYLLLEIQLPVSGSKPPRNTNLSPDCQKRLPYCLSQA